MPPARFAAQSLEARLTTLVERAAGCLETPDPYAVHDLRVAIRRFSQALRIFRPLLDPKAVQRIRRALKRVMDAAAAVRDLDVGIERLTGEGLPERHAVLEEMRAERRRGELALRGWLLIVQSEEPASAWRRCLVPRPARSAGARAS